MSWQPRTIVNYATCDKASVPEQTKLPYLDYGVFAGIVGDCAYAEGGCPITMQNFVDLVYGVISTEKGVASGSQYPSCVPPHSSRRPVVLIFV